MIGKWDPFIVSYELDCIQILCTYFEIRDRKKLNCCTVNILIYINLTFNLQNMIMIILFYCRQIKKDFISYFHSLFTCEGNLERPFFGNVRICSCRHSPNISGVVVVVNFIVNLNNGQHVDRLPHISNSAENLSFHKCFCSMKQL